MKAGAYWNALYGTYGNWMATTLAAIFGTASLSPIIGAGHSALPWQELVVTIGFLFRPRTLGLAARRCVMIVGMFPERIWTRGSWHGSGVPERSALNSWKRSWRR